MRNDRIAAAYMARAQRLNKACRTMHGKKLCEEFEKANAEFAAAIAKAKSNSEVKKHETL